jgi:hypothetical protein
VPSVSITSSICVLSTKSQAHRQWVTCSVSAYVLGIRLQTHCGPPALYLPMPSALDCRRTVGHLLYYVYLCSRHQTTSPLRVTCSKLSCLSIPFTGAWTASPLRATCSNCAVYTGLHINSMPHVLIVRYKSGYKEIAPPLHFTPGERPKCIASSLDVGPCFSCQSKSHCLFTRNAANRHCA